MARLLSWIKGGSGKLFDPERRALIERAASYIERQLAVRRKSFVVEEALRGVDIPAADVPHAVRQAYRLLVTRAWRNGELSTGEHKTLDWAAECLKLDHETALALQRDVGLQVFQDVFARALDDGNVDETEHASLRRCAACLGFPLERLIREYFSAECDDLLRGLFLRCVQDGRLLADEWARLTTTAERLGLDRDELLTVIQKPAERFVERIV